jgi:transposase
MLRGGQVRAMYELRGKGQSIRSIARELGVARNTVRKYLRSPEIPKAKPPAKRASKLDPFKGYIEQRLSHGVDNCVVLLRELREQGYTGSYTILKELVQPSRRRCIAQATMRYETEPGEQAQVDFGRYWYVTPEGRKRWTWAFVMVLSWSRALYVEFVERADTATFARCHIHAFDHFGGVPRRCLYDNTKLVVLRRDGEGRPVWNERFTDFSACIGFDVRLCRPYRARTKGKIERGVGYVKRNFWPSARFVDLADLNRQGMHWAASVADVRIHGTTHERPTDRLAIERSALLTVPGRSRLTEFLREERKVGRDGFVRYGGAWYGVPWTWAGSTVQLDVDEHTVAIFSGEERLALHPRAGHSGQRQILPGQWHDLPTGDTRPPRSPLAFQLAAPEVERRSLYEYAAVVEEATTR